MKFRDRYKFETSKDFIGKGGFSKVYKAFDVIRKRNVALKFYSGIESDKYDIISEINRMDDLVHPNLIRYYDATIIDSQNAIGEKEQIQIGIMEYANAGDIGSIFKQPQSPQITHNIITDIVKGLQYLHEKGIVHRALKPKNILLSDEDGRLMAKICDFGISKKIEGEDAAVSSQLLGSVEYMAPEQFAPAVYGIDGKFGTNADLWSLGIILYEIFAQTLPFGSRTKGITYEHILNNILFKDLELDFTNIPAPYDTIIRKCLVKKAANRIKSASDVLDILEGRTQTETPIVTPTNNETPTTVIPNDPQKNQQDQNQQNNTPKNDNQTKVLTPVNEKEPPVKNTKNTPIANKLPSSQTIVNEITTAKNAFKVGNYPESFKILEKYEQYDAFDTECKFFLGYMYYNGKVGGAHDPVAGRRLMNEAKEEDHALVIELMVKYVLNKK